MYQAHLFIIGKVQGVFYRASCQEVAQRLGLMGSVKNLLDGQVEVLAQGKKEEIEKLIEWCKKGPPQAQVNTVNVKWENTQEMFDDFQIL